MASIIIECPRCGKEIPYPRDGNKIALFDNGYVLCCPTCTQTMRIYVNKDKTIKNIKRIG